MATFKRRVAYLESTGTQYIDTGIYFDPQQDFEAALTAATVGNARSVILSSYYSGGFSSFGLEWGASSQGRAYTPRAYVQVNNIFDLWDGVQTINTRVAINARWDHLDKRVIMDVNGISYNLHNSTVSLGTEVRFSSSTSSPISLFTSYNNNIGHGGISHFYQRKANGVEINLVPVLNLSNNRPAMYDTVSGQLFYNQGTDEFLYGEL